MLMLWKRTLPVLMLGAILGPGPVWAAGDAVRDKIEKPVRQAIDTQQATQKVEEAWRRNREKRMALLASLQQEQARLKEEEAHLQQEQTARRERIAAKTHQLAAGEEIGNQLAPYLEEVLAALRARIDADQPFLSEERRRRMDNLGTLLADPSITVSEKFRKTMEALMVEAEYGRTIEVYPETITVDGQPLLAMIFRLGRIGIFYQTLDHSRSGLFDVASRTWIPLPPSFDNALQTAVDIGAKRQPVELLSLPLGRMAAP